MPCSATLSSSGTGSVSDHPAPSTPSTSRPPSPIASGSTLLTAGHVRLPTRLPRPSQCECVVEPSTLDFDPQLQVLPTEYVVDQLRTMGNDLLLATASTTVDVPPAAANGSEPLPSHLAISMPPGGGLQPTHVLAVHGQDAADVLLLPAHGLLYALGCAALPHLSRSRPADDGSERLPVAHLHVPSTSAFPLLAAYLTSHSPSALLARLLPSSVNDLDDGALLSPSALAGHLAHAETHESLGKHVRLVHGLWADACALGVSDDVLWGQMQLAWSVLVGALALRTAKLQAEMQQPASTTGPAETPSPAPAEAATVGA